MVGVDVGVGRGVAVEVETGVAVAVEVGVGLSVVAIGSGVSSDNVSFLGVAVERILVAVGGVVGSVGVKDGVGLGVVVWVGAVMSCSVGLPIESFIISVDGSVMVGVIGTGLRSVMAPGLAALLALLAMLVTVWLELTTSDLFFLRK
jgi:hypothetical protein